MNAVPRAVLTTQGRGRDAADQDPDRRRHQRLHAGCVRTGAGERAARGAARDREHRPSDDPPILAHAGFQPPSARITSSRRS